MFHIDMTAEDVRTILTSKDGETYVGKFVDAVTGAEYTEDDLSAKEAVALMVLFTDSEGEHIEKATHAVMYECLEPLLERIPDRCRPIP